LEREKLEFRESGEEGWIGGYNFCMVKSSNGVEVKIASKSFKEGEAVLFWSLLPEGKYSDPPLVCKAEISNARRYLAYQVGLKIRYTCKPYYTTLLKSSVKSLT